MFLIVGLGNPGPEYKDTRHNIGWYLLERFIKATGLPEAWHSQTYAGMVSEGVFKSEDVRILFPHTYMNRSGAAVLKGGAKELEPSRIIVVHDDIDLPFGSIRVSFDRGAGGHNGVRSIIDALGNTKFVRIRIGIAHTTIFGTLKRPTGDALSNYVLAPFTKREMAELEKLAPKFIEALTLCVTLGVEKAMQEINAP